MDVVAIPGHRLDRRELGRLAEVHCTVPTGLPMLLRFATVLLTVLLPLAAVAQRAAPATLAEAERPLFDRLLSVEVGNGPAGSGNQVVPLWASPDGRLLAIVALSRASGAPTLPPSPTFGGVSDLRIVDATDLFSAGLRLRLGEGLRADLTVGSEFGSRLPYHIDGACAGCAAGLGPQPAEGISNAAIGLGWSAPFASGLDLSFGLSWLDGRRSDLPVLADGALPGSPIDLTLVDGSEGMPYSLASGRRLSARGIWQLGHGPILDLTAALTRAELAPVWYGLPGPSLDLNQASLGLGLASGSLRGSIVGRINSLEDPGVIGTRRWGGLDLGVSWRTPWRGELTVGAQNLWSAPLESSSAGEKDTAQARVPYVQYRQDL